MYLNHQNCLERWESRDLWETQPWINTMHWDSSYVSIWNIYFLMSTIMIHIIHQMSFYFILLTRNVSYKTFVLKYTIFMKFYISNVAVWFHMYCYSHFLGPLRVSVIQWYFKTILVSCISLEWYYLSLVLYPNILFCILVILTNIFQISNSSR